MARKLRIQYPGAIYHVMKRGDHREAIFRSEPDCQLLLDTLAEACVKTDWQIHTWCWMSNHFTFACSGGGATAAKPFGKSCWRK